MGIAEHSAEARWEFYDLLLNLFPDKQIGARRVASLTVIARRAESVYVNGVLCATGEVWLK